MVPNYPVRLAVPAKLPAGSVNVRFASCACANVQLPSALCVPADNAPPLGTPVICTDRLSVPSVAVSAEAMFSAIAVPAPVVNAVLDTLLQKGRIPHGYLGVGLQPVRLPEALRQSLQHDEKTAAIVLEVEPEGPAHKAGIVIGDIFVSLGGHSVARLEDVHSQLNGSAIGKPLALKFVRGGAVQEASLVVAERSHGGR